MSVARLGVHYSVHIRGVHYSVHIISVLHSVHIRGVHYSVHIRGALEQSEPWEAAATAGEADTQHLVTLAASGHFTTVLKMAVSCHQGQ